MGKEGWMKRVGKEGVGVEEKWLLRVGKGRGSERVG